MLAIKAALPQWLMSGLGRVKAKSEHSTHGSKTKLCYESRNANGFSENTPKKLTLSSEIEINGENHFRALNSSWDMSRLLSCSLHPECILCQGSQSPQICHLGKDINATLSLGIITLSFQYWEEVEQHIFYMSRWHKYSPCVSVTQEMVGKWKHVWV